MEILWKTACFASTISLSKIISFAWYYQTFNTEVISQTNFFINNQWCNTETPSVGRPFFLNLTSPFPSLIVRYVTYKTKHKTQCYIEHREESRKYDTWWSISMKFKVFDMAMKQCQMLDVTFQTKWFLTEKLRIQIWAVFHLTYSKHLVCGSRKYS